MEAFYGSWIGVVKRLPAATNAFIWALMGFGAGAIMMIWIFNAN
jgi:hypothetical protein